jgi:hypothetical protein
MNWKLLMIVTILVLGIVALGRFGHYIIRRWERNDPLCSKCGTRRKNVEPIVLGGMNTSYMICTDCLADNTVRNGDYCWPCVLYNLHRTAKTMHVNMRNVTESYDVTIEQYWPKDSNGKPLALDEIMMLVLEDSLGLY